MVGIHQVFLAQDADQFSMLQGIQYVQLVAAEFVKAQHGQIGCFVLEQYGVFALDQVAGDHHIGQDVLVEEDFFDRVARDHALDSALGVQNRNLGMGRLHHQIGQKV